MTDFFREPSQPFTVSNEFDSFAVSQEFEGANSARAAALVTWAIGQRETVAQLRPELVQLGFSDRMLEVQPPRDDDPFGQLPDVSLDGDTDERRALLWYRLTDTASLSDALAFLRELLMSPLERESATAAAALWRLLSWLGALPPRQPLSWPVVGPTGVDDDVDVLPWDGEAWVRACRRHFARYRLRWWAPYSPPWRRDGGTTVRVVERLGGALQASDVVTRELATAAFLSLNPGPPPGGHGMSRPPSRRGAVSTIVHGTNAWAGEWWLPGGDFFDFISGKHRANLFKLGTRFNWDGFPLASHRVKASVRFAEWAQDAAPNGLETVFAHSYGGEVVARTLNSGLSANEVVLLSAPVTPNVAALCGQGVRVIDVRLPFDIVIGLTGYGQRLQGANVSEVVLKGWDWSHGASHDPVIWQQQDVAVRAGL